MSDAGRATQAEVANAIAATLDSHLIGLAGADQTPRLLKDIVAKLGEVTSKVACALAPGAIRERGQVLLFVASKHACNAAAMPAIVALNDLIKPGAQGDPNDAAPGTDPIDDPDLQRNLGRRYASEAVRKVLEAGWTPEQILGGWIVVTGVAAWEGDELQAIQTDTFLQDTLLH